MSEHPNNWISCLLGERVQFQYGKSPNEVRSSKGTYPVYGSSGKTSDAVDFTTDSPSIIVGRKGTIDKPIFLEERCWAIDTTFFIDKFPHDYPKYLFYLLDSINLKSLNESTGVPSLSRDALHSLAISLPPLTEQKKIAEILSGIDKQIGNQQSNANKHKHLLQGILDLVMTQGTRGRAIVDTDAGKVPNNWSIGSVEDFFALGRGRVISIPHIKDHPGPYPVFSSQSKNNGEMGRMDTYDFDGDYFTWTTDGAYAGSVFARSGKFNCTNVCGTGKAKSPGDANTKFAAYFLQRVAKGHVSYVGNPKLMNNAFAKIPFALPPIDEQVEISKIIDSVKRNIDLIEKQITSLSNLKKSISSDLLSGRKRVSV